MGARRRARECALQLLYMWEFHRQTNDFDTEPIWAENQEDDATRQFAETIVNGVIENIEDIDNIIKSASLNWRIDRMAIVDRNILRIATWELLKVMDTPLKVVLNEAIELGKKFGSEDSSAFVNGVLDKVGSLVRKEQEGKGGK
jgi:N utilization substance protein B